MLADDLVMRVYDATRGFPREEMFRVTSQMRRAAYSVPCNIVEGCGRNTEKDFLRFLDNSSGSLRELGYLIGLSRRLGYLRADLADDLESRHNEASRALAGLIASLRSPPETRH